MGLGWAGTDKWTLVDEQVIKWNSSEVTKGNAFSAFVRNNHKKQPLTGMEIGNGTFRVTCE